MKQTAVEWLVLKLNQEGYAPVVTQEEYNQAKEMEKEQHLESYRVGNTFTNSASLDFKDFFDEYYNKTYGGDE
jgi:hypothetical protein